jgi:flagellar M-ring protein FliF
MNFFKQSSDQAREAFTAMPMQSRIISVMLVAAIAIGLAFLVRGVDSEKSIYLFGGKTFGEHEVDVIEMAFSKAGLSDWQREGRRIKVPNEAKSTYLAALEESSTLPSTLQSSVQEAINATGPFDSNDLMLARQRVAKEADLSKRIAMLPEVKSASVVYDRGERRGLSQNRPQSASIVVVPEGGAPLPRHRIAAIREMIRASYAGMNSDDVDVVDTNGTTASSMDDDEDPLLRKQQETEDLWKRKIRSALSAYPATVEVYAEIDPIMDVEKASLTYDAEGTAVNSQSRKIESSSNRQPNRGVPGTAPNAIGNRSASLEDNLQTRKLSDKREDVEKVAGQQYENSRVAPLKVKAINVTVGLPRSYFKAIYTQEQLEKDPTKTVADVPPLSDEDFEQLKTKTFNTIEVAVSRLLPIQLPGDDRTSKVDTFVTPDLPAEPPPPSDTTKVALTWLADSWQTIAMIFLALIALLVARSAARATGDTPPAEFREGFGLTLPKPPPEPEMTEEEDAMTITGGNLKDELVVIVEGNPEVAANVIRSWVGDAA